MNTNHKEEGDRPILQLKGVRIYPKDAYQEAAKAAERVGLHNSESEQMEDHFPPHNCRHRMTTHLRREGMRHEFIQELRGDSRRDAIDIYDHIDPKKLKEAYLACIPQIGT